LIERPLLLPPSLFPYTTLFRSFSSYSPISRDGPSFIGWDNYAAIVNDAEFGQAMLVTGRYVLQVLPITVVIALGLAILSNRTFRDRKSTRLNSSHVSNSYAVFC